MSNDDVNITTRQLAESIPVDPSTVRRWVETGKLKPDAVTAGGHYRFNRQHALDQMHAAGRERVA